MTKSNRRSRRRKQQQTIGQISSIISAAALLIIAVLMVVAVVLYIGNNSFLSSLLGMDSVEEENEFSDPVPDITLEEESQAASANSLTYGLSHLSDGNIVYIMDQEEASLYDDEYLLEVTADYYNSEDILSGSEKAYYLVNNWLDYNDNLYRFDANGYACLDTYSEYAFKFYYDENGMLEEINYNRSYQEDASTARDGYPGLISTKALWVFMDSSNTIGDYTALKYRKTTESLSAYLGGTLNTQYASEYAYDIAGNRIFYLAVPGTGSSDSSSVLDNIVGKVFCMSPGADYREIAAEDAEGFKVLVNPDGTTIVYYYDGRHIYRSSSFEKDDNMVIFSENADYTVDISEGDKAYLELSTGQRVTLESESFKSGNFTYSLASDGEILAVAAKKTVVMNGYTYEVQNGTAFGQSKIRVVRTDSSGESEIVSAEVSGSTENIHYDYGTESIIAEYMDANSMGGLLKISLDGDIDYITGSKSTGENILYDIEDGRVIFRTEVDGTVLFRSAEISSTTPLAAGIDPVKMETEETEEVETVAPDDYDQTNGETIAAETVSAPQTAEISSGNIVSVEGPGSVSTVTGSGPGSSSAASTAGPGTD